MGPWMAVKTYLQPVTPTKPKVTALRGNELTGPRSEYFTMEDFFFGCQFDVCIESLPRSNLGDLSHLFCVGVMYADG